MSIEKKYLQSLLILVGVAFSSCTSPSYVVNSRNVPQFGEAKEFSAVAGLSAVGGEVQTAYAITNHLAVMGNTYVVSVNDQRIEPFLRRKHFFGEAGIGYFAKNEVARFEVFGGYGIGHDVGRNNYGFLDLDDYAIVTSDYQRIFIQPSISTNEKKVNFSLTARVTGVRFGRFSAHDNTRGLVVYHPGDPYRIFIEPAVTTRFVLGGNFYGIFQIAISGPQGDRYVYFDYTPVEMLIGVQYHTGKRKE